jgi:hypothetical protein
LGALIAFAVAIALCAVTFLFGPGLGQSAGALLVGEDPSQYPARETITTIMVFGALLLFALAGGAAWKANALAPGRKPARMAAIGAALGVGGVCAAATYAWVAGALGAGTPAPFKPGLLIWGTLVILFATAVEEIYFRGWLQPVLSAQYGTAAGVLLSALAFAALHLVGSARSPLSLANLFLGGLLFGLLAARGGGIAGAVAAHLAWNWTEQIVLGLDPNPGVGSFGALFAFDLSGPALWGGSDEGMNASIAMTMALTAMLVPLVVLARSGVDPGRKAVLADMGKSPTGV